MNPKVSWMNDIKKKDNLLKEMREFKIKATVEELCKGERC